MSSELIDKIEKIVVVMLENRSLDTVLGYLYNEDEKPKNHIPALPNGAVLFEGLAFVDTTTLVNSATYKGQAITQIPEPIVRATNSTGWDPGEEFEHVNAQIFDIPPTNSPGEAAPITMTGFLRDYSLKCSGDVTAVKQIMHMFTPADLPILNGLAKSYAVCDEWFASVPTQTNANRAFSLAGTSNGLVDNGFLSAKHVPEMLADDRFDVKTIWNVLHDNGKGSVSDWGVYWQNGYPLPGQNPYTLKIFPQLTDAVADGHFHPMDNFFEQAQAGTLPSFSYIEPSWGGYVFGHASILGTDYHPPGDVTPGEHMLAQIYASLTSNQESWEKTLLVIVFDEHGGTYDHVAPPKTATPPWGNDPNPSLPKGKQYGFDFDRFGVRVPAILVSPLIEESTVFRSNTDVPYDHTSMIATILEWMLPDVDKAQWGLGERVANAPTFDNVVTRAQPRSDNLFAPQATKTGPINFGDPVSLQNNETGEMIINAYSGYLAYYPQLAGQSPQDIDFRMGYGAVQDGDLLQIRTSEYLQPEANRSVVLFAGIRNFIGAWTTDTYCYYYTPNDYEDYKQMKWTIKRVSGDSGPIQSGDQVQFINQYYNEPLSKKGAYLTAKSASSDFWTIRHKIWPTTVWQQEEKGTNGPIYQYSLSPTGQSPKPASFKAFDKHYPTTVPVYAYTLAQAGGGFIWFYSPSSVTPPSFVSKGVAFYAYAEEQIGKSEPVYLFTFAAAQQYYYYSSDPTPPNGFKYGGVVFNAPV